MFTLSLALLLLHLSADTLQGWSAGTHRHIAARAAETSPPPLRDLLLRHRGELLAGVVAPDRKGPGWIPSTGHIHHYPERGSRPRKGSAPDRIALMLRRLGTGGALSPARQAFELGRICHLVADLNQPLHADGGSGRKREQLFHSRFERDVQRFMNGSQFSARPLPPNPIGSGLGLPAFLIATSRKAMEGYNPIERAYLEGGGLPAVRDMALEQVGHSIRGTVRVWTQLDLAPEGPRWIEESTPILQLLLVLAAYSACCRPRCSWLRNMGPRERVDPSRKRWFQRPRDMISEAAKMITPPATKTRNTTEAMASPGSTWYGSRAEASVSIIYRWQAAGGPGKTGRQARHRSRGREAPLVEDVVPGPRRPPRPDRIGWSGLSG